MSQFCNESYPRLPRSFASPKESLPAEVIAGFFNAYKPEECHHYLWQMLKWYGREKSEESVIELPDCLFFFEKLICFIEAAYLLHHKAQSGSPEEDVAKPGKDTYQVTDPENPLSQVIRIIKHSMDAEKIFLLGTYPLHPAGLGNEYDLLVLVNDTRNRPNDEFESLINNRTADTVPVFASVYKLSKVNEMIRKGNYFFCTSCVPEKLIYDAGRIPLTTAEATEVIPINDLKQIHDGWMEKANGFYMGAVKFLQAGQFSLCGFMLHQAAEHSLNALLQPLMQFRVLTHNLHKLIRYARRFSPEICSFFPRDTDAEIRLFQLLQKAYIHARYKDTFELKEEEAKILLERVQSLLQTIAEVSAKLMQGE